MTGPLAMGANDITIDHNPDAANKVVRKAYVDLFLPLAGSTMTGRWRWEDLHSPAYRRPDRGRGDAEKLRRRLLRCE